MSKHTATRAWPNSEWQTDMPFPAEVIAKGEWRGDIETQGPCGMLSKYRALAMEQTDQNIDTNHFEPYQTTAILHGVRSLLNPKESGYQLEGYVSIDGKKRRAFTSSAMFEVNGKLVDIAIIYICKEVPK